MARTSDSPSATPLSAAIHRYFEVALYLLVLTGFTTLASTGGLDLPTVLLVGAALLLRGYNLLQHRVLLIPESWTTILTLAYVAFYLADYLLISRAFLGATVHLVLFVMVVRLFSTLRDRDYYFLAVISFLMVLASAVLTVDSTFLLAFAGFMLMAVPTFILMEMRRASRQATVQANAGDEAAHRGMAFSLAAVSPALMICILLGAGAIFFILPRISSGYLSAIAPGGEIATGFSDQVQLGRIGQIQQSTSLVMHIQIDGDARGAFDLKWRGVALNDFDGSIWSNPHEQHVLPRLPGGRFGLRQPTADGDTGWPLRPKHSIHYRVLMEPLSGNVFFLAPTPYLLEGNYRAVSMDGGGAVFNLDSEHPVSRYEATSDLTQPTPDQLRDASSEYPPQVLLDYLQLPRLDPRIQPLAEQITASANNNYDRAFALEAYLRTHFGYSLQLSRFPPRDPVANFLFERKQGHCEYFASAMAIMLRSLRIPSRIVNGFRTGEFNDVTSQYLVRASNAHSWVEVYFPGYGWISFDPTPAAPAQLHTGWSRVMLYADALASFWREWVINYDASHQYSLGRQATRGSLEWYQRMRFWWHRHYLKLLAAARRTRSNVSDSPVRWSLVGVMVTLFLFLGANARRLWQVMKRRRLAARPEKSPRLAATVWYERMTRMLARRGWRKSPVQTPEEFVKSVGDGRVRESVARFTGHYERARFDNSPEDAGRLPELYDEVAIAARK